MFSQFLWFCLQLVVADGLRFSFSLLLSSFAACGSFQGCPGGAVTPVMEVEIIKNSYWI